MTQGSGLAPCEFQGALQALLRLRLLRLHLPIAGNSCRRLGVACNKSGRHCTHKSLQMCTSGGLAAAAIQAEPVHGLPQTARRALCSVRGQHGCCAKLCTRGQQSRDSPARRAPSPAPAAAGPLRRGTAAPCSTPAPAAPAAGFCLTLQGSGGSMGQHNCGRALHPCSGGRSQHQQCCAIVVALL